MNDDNIQWVSRIDVGAFGAEPQPVLVDLPPVDLPASKLRFVDSSLVGVVTYLVDGEPK